MFFLLLFASQPALHNDDVHSGVNELSGLLNYQQPYGHGAQNTTTMGWLQYCQPTHRFSVDQHEYTEVHINGGGGSISNGEGTIAPITSQSVTQARTISVLFMGPENIGDRTVNVRTFPADNRFYTEDSTLVELTKTDTRISPFQYKAEEKMCCSDSVAPFSNLELARKRDTAIIQSFGICGCCSLVSLCFLAPCAAQASYCIYSRYLIPPVEKAIYQRKQTFDGQLTARLTAKVVEESDVSVKARIAFLKKGPLQTMQ